MSKKKKYMAYILHVDDEFGYMQKKIAALMDVSQSTISNAVKEMRYEAEIYITCSINNRPMTIVTDLRLIQL